MKAEKYPDNTYTGANEESPWDAWNFSAEASGDADPSDSLPESEMNPSEDEIETQRKLYELHREQEVDRQILGRSVKLREDIRESGANVLTKGETLWAQIKNLPGEPRQKYREMRISIAEKRLENKETRVANKKSERQSEYDARETKLNTKLQDKRLEDQAWVNQANSDRQQRLRQEKIDKKHDKRKEKVDTKLVELKARHTSKDKRQQTKVESYKKAQVTGRTERYESTKSIRDGRLTGAEKNGVERSKKVQEAREAAITKKEVAIARREVRHKLRAERSESGMGLRERRAMMKDIFGAGDHAVGEKRLKELGRSIVERNSGQKQWDEAGRAATNARLSTEVIASQITHAESALRGVPEAISRTEGELEEATKDKEAEMAWRDVSIEELRKRGASEDEPSSDPQIQQWQRHLKDTDERIAQMIERETSIRTQLEKYRFHYDSLNAYKTSLQHKIESLSTEVRKKRADAAVRKEYVERSSATASQHVQDIFTDTNVPKAA